MELDDVAHDRQAETKTAVCMCQGSVRLPERVKEFRQMFRADTDPGIAECNVNLRSSLFDSDAHASTGRREFERVDQEVAKGLL